MGKSQRVGEEGRGREAARQGVEKGLLGHLGSSLSWDASCSGPRVSITDPLPSPRRMGPQAVPLGWAEPVLPGDLVACCLWDLGNLLEASLSELQEGRLDPLSGLPAV